MPPLSSAAACPSAEGVPAGVALTAPAISVPSAAADGRGPAPSKQLGWLPPREAAEGVPCPPLGPSRLLRGRGGQHVKRSRGHLGEATVTL